MTATIGKYTDVSRVYIIIDSSDGKTSSNKYEWCNIDINPQINDLQDIPYDEIPSLRKFLIEEGMVYSENIHDLPDDLRAILKEFANIISGNIRPYDLFGRYVVEEFLIASSDMTKSQAAVSMFRILEKLRERIFSYNDINIRFTFSAGTDSSEFDISVIRSEMIISKADFRLYRAKESGRNMIISE